MTHITRKHYWLVVVRYQDGYSSLYVDTTAKFLNERVLDGCVEQIKAERKSSDAVIVSVSYLGEMSQKEWEQ